MRELINTVVEAVFWGLIPGAVLALWIRSIVAVIAAIFKKKERPYSREDKIFSAVDIALLAVFIWCATRYMLYGFMGEPEGWRNILRNVASVVANLTAPLSVWSVAASISRRKTEEARRYPLSVLVCIPVHAFCMTAFYLIYGTV